MLPGTARTSRAWAGVAGAGDLEQLGPHGGEAFPLGSI